MRSLLFVPGDSEKKLEKGLNSDADILIVDLEDSVAADNKAEARRVAAKFISERRGDTSARFYVRVNDLETGLIDDDLAAVMAAAPEGIMLPKCQNGQDVTHLAAKLRVHEAEFDIEDGATRILPLITETATGTLAAGTYRDCSDRLSGITWGAEDLSADIGARTARDEAGHYTDVFRFARMMTILAAASAEVPAIDTVFPNFRDLDAFRAECLEAERDGFTARMAIHPSQVAVVNEAFTPSPESVALAQKIVGAFAEAGNPGVVAIGGEMYDRPHLRRSERILARARDANGIG